MDACAERYAYEHVLTVLWVPNIQSFQGILCTYLTKLRGPVLHKVFFLACSHLNDLLSPRTAQARCVTAWLSEFLVALVYATGPGDEELGAMTCCVRLVCTY